MITQVRLARPQIILDGKDFYSELAPYFLNLEYTDNCDGETCDDLQLQLADRDRRFINDWMPDVGTSLDVKIMCERWFAPNAGTLLLDCGKFWIDCVEFDLPAHTVSVKATSIPTDQHAKDDETRGWEKGDLKQIAGQITDENGMELDYQAEYNPKYKRVEQTEQSGLGFLRERTTDVGLGMKATKGKLVIFDEADMEQVGPSFTLVYGDIPGSGCYRMTGGHFVRKVWDTTGAAEVEHVNLDTGMLTKETFEESGGGEGGMSESTKEWIRKLPESPEYAPDENYVTAKAGTREENGDEDAMPDINNNDPFSNEGKGAGGRSAAQRKAKAAVRQANKERETASVELSIGNPLVCAGQTFMLKGVGQFDGKWFIYQAKHTVGPMYKTELEIRRCLEGY
jgi:phage protein D